MNIYDSIPAPALMADLILAAHALVVAFVLVGQVLILAGWVRGWQWVRNPWFRLTHLGTIVFVAAQAWLGELCPLTVWEQRLRSAAGQASYEVSFIEHWVGQVLFYDLPWWTFVAAYTAFALLVIATWWWVPPRWRHGSA